MKKILLFIICLLVGVGIYYIYGTYSKNSVPKLEIEEHVVNVDKLYTYGTHLNIIGSNIPNEDLDLVLYNGEFISININITGNSFNISDYINDGFYLDNLENGYYNLFLRSTSFDEEGNNVYKYYPLNNNTGYDKTIYYTMSNYNKKITIKYDDEYSTIGVVVKNNKDSNVYDIVLDAGHGGKDPGATKYGYSETDFTLDIALKVKEKLEASGIRVKLTRDADTLTDEERLPEYGVHGRAVIPGEVKAKYLFSFHLNSSNSTSVNGLEVYTPVKINYDFSKLLVNNIITNTGLGFSRNNVNKVYDGIYSRTFTSKEVEDSINDYVENSLIPYDITTDTNYYYIIRETGGIVTGAYVDDRNPDIISNPNTSTNTGTEAYLLELGYITNKSDLNNMKNNMDKYVDAVVNSILTLY
ncbi:MAG: N-acetylmuramoyl-L-alanine amidase [Bacilli bacterium]|nr:N-acetylmuramoyl-L-alanine amidase [Bacilli bacterium]